MSELKQVIRSQKDIDCHARRHGCGKHDGMKAQEVGGGTHQTSHVVDDVGS